MKMATLKLTILDREGVTRASSLQGKRISMVYSSAYEPGDRILLETDAPGLFCTVQFEDSMAPATIFVKGTKADFPIPPPDNRPNYSPKSFTGAKHVVRARIAAGEEISARRCLSFNPYDSHGGHGLYPHASANVETRNEAVFAARNAIDGIFENTSHGEYPYESWGINRDPNAQLTVAFGREVLIDEIRITLRADFPHDNYWEKATVEFSDGSGEILKLGKTADTQIFPIAPRAAESAILKDLIRAEGPSPFPALTQIEFYGSEAKAERNR
jgi:hypothetical protein